MNSATVILTAVGAVLTLTAIAGAAVAVWRSSSIRAALDTIQTINEELRQSNDDLRHELATEREKRANLEGRLDALTTDLADRIVKAVIAAMRTRSTDHIADRNG